ncbi:MAG: GNAT family N-acetyltransferase [Chloroflexi bacterium]|nr:GNAT family N-acetyltransferase [Chloroflexota bacterium]
MAIPERDNWQPPLIEGRGVVLRRHRPENLEAVVRWYHDPELARLTRYQTRPMTREEVERFFHARLLSPESVAYAIHERGTDRLIGVTTFSSLDGDNGSALFHITIGEPDAWGRGFGTEATELMLQHAFERLGLHRIGLSVFEFNERAIRAYEKAGFVIEGRLREAILRDGRYWDEVQMGALATDWLRQRRERLVQVAAETNPGRQPVAVGFRVS